MVPCPKHLPPLSDHAQCCLGPSRARGPRLGPEPCRPALRYGNRRLTQTGLYGTCHQCPRDSVTGPAWPGEGEASLTLKEDWGTMGAPSGYTHPTHSGAEDRGMQGNWHVQGP